MYDDNLPMRRDSAIKYILDHETLSSQFLSARIREDDWVTAMNRLTEGNKSPVIYANLLINNISLMESERVRKSVELVATAGNTTVMIGAKRFGKTCTATWMIENWLSEGIKVFWFGYSPIIRKCYPQIIQTFNIRKVENGILIIDEAAVHDPSRGFMGKEQSDRMAQIFTQGHSDYSSIFISQTFRVDIRILNTMDVLWLKPFFQLDFDREQAGAFFTEAYEYIRPIQKNENLVINCQENNSWFFSNGLPDKWCDELSKPFARIKLKDEATEYLKMLLESGISQKETDSWLKQRGWTIKELLGEETPEAAGKDPFNKSTRGKQSLQGKEGIKLLQCPKCKSTEYMRQGFYGKVQKYRCKDCGKIFTEAF